MIAASKQQSRTAIASTIGEWAEKLLKTGLGISIFFMPLVGCKTTNSSAAKDTVKKFNDTSNRKNDEKTNNSV